MDVYTKNSARVLLSIGALCQEKLSGTEYLKKCFQVCDNIWENSGVSSKTKMRALHAIHQSLSKGVADSEEVRLQFAEVLPEMIDKTFWDEYVENGRNNLPTPLTSFIDCLHRNRQHS